eukprot:4340927-Pyramimonas_sp.AAC.1
MLGVEGWHWAACTDNQSGCVKPGQGRGQFVRVSKREDCPRAPPFSPPSSTAQGAPACGCVSIAISTQNPKQRRPWCFALEFLGSYK